MKVLFVDSNFFFQCRGPRELQWEEVADGSDVLVFVARAVQEEVDRQKQGGNSRRARRARKASSFFREMLRAEDFRITIRATNPEVVFSFPPPFDASAPFPHHLDLAHADDRIIREALEYKSQTPQADVALITHDTNPMLTARQSGLRYIEVPDNWLLTPEPDERDKALAEISRRVSALERDAPNITIATLGIDETDIAEVIVAVDIFPELQSSEIESLVKVARKNHPMAEQFIREKIPDALGIAGVFGRRYRPPSDEEIRTYKEETYPNWLDRLRVALKQLPRHLENPGRHSDMQFVLTNDGVRPAENVIVEIMARGGIQIAPPKEEAADGKTKPKPPPLPGPPAPPSGTYADFSLSNLRVLGPEIGSIWQHARPRERDRYKFYHRSSRPTDYLSEWAYQCAEFRHKADPEAFELKLFIPPEMSGNRAAITCRVSASNLPEPKTVTVPVVVQFRRQDTFAAAEALIRRWRGRRLATPSPHAPR